MCPAKQNEFVKCPELDREIKEWATVHPEIKDAFFGDTREYKKFVYTLATLKTVDATDNKLLEYGFTEDKIQTIVEHYKEDEWNVLIENVPDDVKKCREESDKENAYINNVIREWKDYDVPSAENGKYILESSGVYKASKSINEITGKEQYVTKDVCRTPFVICGKSKPLNGTGVYYKIRFVTDEGIIEEFWANQSTLLSRKELKNQFLLKGINCPENLLLMETIEYISRSIADFGTKLKKEFSAKQNGWNEDKSIFVLGDRAITANGIEPILSVGNAKGFPELEKKGTLEGWMLGTRAILDYDLIRFKCYDALSAPLKSILGIESHATDHYGNTSCGKTFSGQIALSMIGDGEGLTIGAKSTAKGILVHIRDFSDLPILIDESSDAGDHLADLVYPLTSNKGRVKSTVDGQRDGGEEFHTTTMFTGERPIRDCLQNSGQQYRVNELDDTLPDLPTKEINAVKNAIRDNHGHIIELYLREVMKWRENGMLQTTYDKSFDKLPENTSNIEGRSRSIFACIMTAGYILEQVFYDLKMPQKRVPILVNKYFKKCIQDKPVELEYIRALRSTLDWVHSEYGRFGEVEQIEIPDNSNDGGYLNQYITESTKAEYVTQHDKNKRYGWVDSYFIDIIGSEFTKKMKDEGFSPSKIKEDWCNQGITECNDTTRKGSCRFTREKKTIAGIRINRRIAEELTGLNCEVDNEDDSDLSHNDKIKSIIKCINFLTEMKGEAEIQLMRQILNVPDLEEMLRILSMNGKVMKISQTAYKSI